MFTFLPSAVVYTDDGGRGRYAHERLKVFAKFTADDCATVRLRRCQPNHVCACGISPDSSGKGAPYL